MGLTRVETALTWSSATSKSLNSASVFASDAFSLDATTIGATLAVSADNSGTPASGDIVNFYLAYTSGDLLADGGDDYDTDEHATYLGTVDTYATNTPGEDPARRTLILPTAVPKGAKLLAQAPNGASRAITIMARLTEQRAS